MAMHHPSAHRLSLHLFALVGVLLASGCNRKQAAPSAPTVVPPVSVVNEPVRTTRGEIAGVR